MRNCNPKLDLAENCRNAEKDLNAQNTVHCNRYAPVRRLGFASQKDKRNGCNPCPPAMQEVQKKRIMSQRPKHPLRLVEMREKARLHKRPFVRSMACIQPSNPCPQQQLHKQDDGNAQSKRFQSGRASVRISGQRLQIQRCPDQPCQCEEGCKQMHG